MKKLFFSKVSRAMRVTVLVLLTGFLFTMGVSAQANSPQWNLPGVSVIDLSHVEDQTVPCDPSLKKATLDWFARVGQGDGAYWNLETISYCPHVGTHMDAPFHVNSSWGSIETVNPTILIGPAVILDIKIPSSNYSITADDIKAAEARGSDIQAGDAVLLHTGHDKYWPDKKTYIDDGYPILTKEAAEYLVARKARFVGMETISPDGPNTDTHKILLGAGVIIVENLTNLDKVGGTRCYTIGTFPSVKGASGVWIRLLAIR